MKIARHPEIAEFELPGSSPLHVLNLIISGIFIPLRVVCTLPQSGAKRFWIYAPEAHCGCFSFRFERPASAPGFSAAKAVPEGTRTKSAMPRHGKLRAANPPHYLSKYSPEKSCQVFR
jgi:hypothetical protein